MHSTPPSGTPLYTFPHKINFAPHKLHSIHQLNHRSTSTPRPSIKLYTIAVALAPFNLWQLPLASRTAAPLGDDCAACGHVWHCYSTNGLLPKGMGA